LSILDSYYSPNYSIILLSGEWLSELSYYSSVIAAGVEIRVIYSVALDELYLILT